MRWRLLEAFLPGRPPSALALTGSTAAGGLKQKKETLKAVESPKQSVHYQAASSRSVWAIVVLCSICQSCAKTPLLQFRLHTCLQTRVHATLNPRIQRLTNGNAWSKWGFCLTLISSCIAASVVSTLVCEVIHGKWTQFIYKFLLVLLSLKCTNITPHSPSLYRFTTCFSSIRDNISSSAQGHFSRWTVRNWTTNDHFTLLLYLSSYRLIYHSPYSLRLIQKHLKLNASRWWNLQLPFHFIIRGSVCPICSLLVRFNMPTIFLILSLPLFYITVFWITGFFKSRCSKLEILASSKSPKRSSNDWCCRLEDTVLLW